MSQSHSFNAGNAPSGGSSGGSPPTSTMAIVALVLAFLCTPIGLILGIVALVRINNSNGALGGKVLAIIAIVLPLAFIPVCGVMSAIAVPNFMKFQCRSMQTEAKSNLRAMHVQQLSYFAEKGAYANDPAAIEFSAKGANIRYDYAIVEAGPTGYRAEARGKAEMAGDLWTIDQNGSPENTASACD